jgi:RimJ/RimL family protein N-acetyltransferase
MAATLVTERLLLRPWRDEDFAPFAALNADPEVMRYFPGPLTREESDAMAARIAAAIERDGWGLWAVERRDSGEFIGFTGLAVPRFDFPFLPAVEVGWRLARGAWGHGFATEAALASLDHGFGHLGLEEVVSLTSVQNERSQAVMRRLGMKRDAEGDFEHPAYRPGDPLRAHVLYRLRSDAAPGPEPSERGGGAAGTGVRGRSDRVSEHRVTQVASHRRTVVPDPPR